MVLGKLAKEEQEFYMSLYELISLKSLLQKLLSLKYNFLSCLT